MGRGLFSCPAPFSVFGYHTFIADTNTQHKDMALIKAQKSWKENAHPAPRAGAVGSTISDEAMERLAKLMSDTPTLKKLHGTEWEIRALKPGTQWLIAEEACKVVKKENLAAGDVLKEFAKNLPSVCRALTLALLNDKGKIYGEEYTQVYDTLMWGEYRMEDWSALLMEVVSLLDVDFFFASTAVIETVRQRTLGRKETMRELRQLQQGLHGGK